jgi:5-formyltetrahydrofolate cyclo-ligase
MMEAAIEHEQFWRACRLTLLERHAAIAPDARRAWNRKITRRLVAAFPLSSGLTLGFRQPREAAFDPRPAVRWLRRRGVRVVALSSIGDDCDGGDHSAANATAGLAHALLIPLVGFDDRGYRLGHGDGLFRRLLATARPQPLKIGIGYALARLPTTRPREDDAPMDFIVTEAGIQHVDRDRLEIIDDLAETRALIAETLRRRHLLDAALSGIAGDSSNSLLARPQYSSPPCYAHELDPFYRDA